ncbi:MAG: hypothetical protein J6S85_01100 [Methanobrevibacter sp.]|nr:hypothetical protein [Methanobrevibacter sp.]MBO7712129.1 hypothetical protein [Methanobrevibacter sp.]
MTIYNILLMISIILTTSMIIWAVKSYWESITAILLMSLGICLFIAMLITSIAQPISLRDEALRQAKERQQIVYQIENLTDDKDRIKLNEWILTYNDWINDVNTEKEVYGWFAWHRDFDMSEHTIIELV